MSEEKPLDILMRAMEQIPKLTARYNIIRAQLEEAQMEFGTAVAEPDSTPEQMAEARLKVLTIFELALDQAQKIGEFTRELEAGKRKFERYRK